MWNKMLISLSRFVVKSAQQALPFFKFLRKEAAFDRTDECDQDLLHLKQTLSETPFLSQPDNEDKLYLYLAVSAEAVSTTLIRAIINGKNPVYFMCKALQGFKIRYQQIEKVSLALINSTRRLRYYFLAHTIIVQTDQPIKKLLGRPNMGGRILKWSLELSECEIQYKRRKSLKAQILAGFVAKMTSTYLHSTRNNLWTIFVGGASSSTGSEACIILENKEGIIIEVSLILSFLTQAITGRRCCMTPKTISRNAIDFSVTLTSIWHLPTSSSSFPPRGRSYGGEWISLDLSP